jgi:hypothetical protein
MITIAGRQVLARAMSGAAVHYAMGAGAGTDPVTSEDTRLAGDGDPATAWHVPLDPGFPVHLADGSGMVVQATFPADCALFDWKEWGLVASSSPLLLSGHAIQELGDGAVLVTRQVPEIPVHSEPKDSSRNWVLRAIVSFG